MEAEKLKAHIDAVQRELLEKYHLTQHSLDELAKYYRYRFHDNWETDNVAHYHFLISADDEESNLAIFLDLYRSFNQLQKNFFGFHLKKYTEADILANPNLISKRGKNDFVLISNCKEEPLTPEDCKVWENIRTILNRPQAPTCFLLASPDVFKQKFQDPQLYAKLYHQTFQYHIEPKRNFSVEDYQNELNHFLNQEFPGVPRTDSFQEEMAKYLSYVLANNPTYHGIDFLEDLKKRVILECYALDQVNVIDERCIPYYDRERAASLTKSSKSESTKSEPTVPMDLVLSPQECGHFFEFAPNSPKDLKAKNVLLLTLSTLNSRSFDNNKEPASVFLSDLPGENPKKYYYQLEPVPYKLIRQFEQENHGQKLDGIIMLCSPETRDKPCKATDPEIGAFSATALNYFKYKTACYAQNLNTPYALSFKEIHADIHSDDTKPDLRINDTLSLIHTVVEEIRTLKQHYPHLNIHIDTHGGFRTTQEILNSVLSLLQMENIFIDPANIHTVEFTESDDATKQNDPNTKQKPTTYITSGGEIFNLMNFVSGIHECINYGQIKSLNQLNDNCSPAGKQVLDDMQTIAEGIQLCDVQKFDKGLEALSKSLPQLSTTESDNKNDRYLSMFHSLIYESYGKELLRSKPHTIDEIKWCIKKGFIQQALTLLESKMPKEIIRNNFFVATHPVEIKVDEEIQTYELFTRAHSGICLSQDIKNLLNGRNTGTPKKNWEFAENYVLQNIGYTQRSSKRAPYVPMEENTNYDTLEKFGPIPTITITNANDKRWNDLSYYVTENPKAEREINVLLRLHMQLKEERNNTNHAGNTTGRLNISIICHALNCYINLYEKILKKLNS